MGNSTTKCTLPAEEISYYESNTVFNSKEIRAIWFHFMNISQNGLSINSSFKAFDSRHPLMLSHLTMNISGIIHEYANNNEISLATPRV
eukprot:gene17484-23037_t